MTTRTNALFSITIPLLRESPVCEINSPLFLRPEPIERYRHSSGCPSSHRRSRLATPRRSRWRRRINSDVFPGRDASVTPISTATSAWSPRILRPVCGNRDRGEPHGSAPPTPPCVRVRTRRFDGFMRSSRAKERSEPELGPQGVRGRHALRALRSLQLRRPGLHPSPPAPRPVPTGFSAAWCA